MSEPTPIEIPVLRAARLTALSAGQVWHAKMPGEHELTCVEIDEVTRRTVALRQVMDLSRTVILGTRRFARIDIVFVERVP